MIKAVLKLTLVYPYVNSLFALLDFMSLYGGNLISAGTLKSTAAIRMPSDKFKIFFGENPRKGKYKVPVGAEYFLEEVEVTEVIIDG